MKEVGIIRWGIIGCGKIAAKFAADLALLPRTTLQGVASRSLARARSFAETHGAEDYYDSYSDLVDSPDIDAIYVATPHTLHRGHTLLSLTAGKHVLCEKPMGINQGEVDTMIAAAQASNLLLMEALWTHFIPAVRDAKAAISDGVIGEVLHMRSDFGFTANLDPTLRLLNPSLGGGALLDIGIYPAYIMLELLGEPSHISAASTIGGTGVDLHTSIIAAYDTGQHAYLESSLRVSTECVTIVYGTEGQLTIESRWHEADSYSVVKDGRKQTFIRYKEGHGYYHEILAFNHCLRIGSRQPLFEHAKSQRLIRFLDRVRREVGLVYPSEP